MFDAAISGYVNSDDVEEEESNMGWITTIFAHQSLLSDQEFSARAAKSTGSWIFYPVAIRDRLNYLVESGYIEHMCFD